MQRIQYLFKLKYLLDELDLTPIAKSKAYQLSGGEKRRLEITRALVTSPKLLLLDEPFSGIDPIAVYEVQKIVRRVPASDHVVDYAVLLTRSTRPREPESHPHRRAVRVGRYCRGAQHSVLPDPVVLFDIDAVQVEIEQLEKELVAVRARMAEMLKEIER